MTREQFEQIARLRTEQPNAASEHMDALSIEEFLQLMNDEDQKVAAAVRAEIPAIAQAVRAIVEAFRRGGRLFYVGAGTSGRLGILDAAECPPTFGVPPTMVQGIIAGGPQSMFRSQEGAEDNEYAGAEAISEKQVSLNDVVCGLSASGRTPFVRGALIEAKRRGAYTILITTNDRTQVVQFGMPADCIIAPNVGPEILAGSTRLKSGTAQKLVLNMLSTAAMVQIGKTCGNIMVDVQPMSVKLIERAKGIIMRIANCDYDTASAYFDSSGRDVKVALVMLMTGCDKETAKCLLAEVGGSVRSAVNLHNRK
ncbi:MAG: N-acetylmuramic acid 6-phosphate etherase [Chlorobi bacterium]|nr:N-acetylmuramic acid 6-phosphate etherase [Chlorobiota bacterium]